MGSPLWLALGLGCGASDKEPEVVAEPELQVTFEDDEDYACALDAYGEVGCWGSVPCHGPKGSQRYSDISAWDEQVCGLTLDHRVVCWSLSGEERHNYAVPTNWSWDEHPPVRFELGLVASFGYWVDSKYGDGQSEDPVGCALNAAGELRCQRLVESDPDSHLWAPYEDVELTQMEMMGSHNGALATNGDLWTSTCDLHLDEPGAPCSTQAQELLVDLGLEEVHVSWIGAYCGRDEEGRVSCVEEYEDFALVSFPETWSQFTVDYQSEEPYHTICGIRPDGSLGCTDGGEPFQVPEAEEAFGGWPEGKFVAIDMDNKLACALREDGELRCWGAEAEEIGELRPCAR